MSYPVTKQHIDLHLDKRTEQPNQSAPAQPSKPVLIRIPKDSIMTRACPEFLGHLDALSTRWTAEEQAAKRRIVGFSHEWCNNVITIDFHWAAAEPERCVSCIWWEERKEAFITCIDLVRIVESLTSVPFDNLEKSRIRYDFDRFKAEKVDGLEHPEFWKTIIQFDIPKPFTHKRDLKLFQWTVIKPALIETIRNYVS